MKNFEIACDRIREVRVAALALVLTLLGTAMPFADYPNDQDIHQTVARISYVFGDVSFSRGDDPDEWQPADRNVPMTLGDRVYAGRDGHLELQITGGNYARLASNTDLTALNLTDETKQFSVNQGLASFQIRRFDEDEIIEVDTPNAAVTFERTGEYRISVDPDGNTRVGVLRGRATVSAGGGQVSLNAAEEMDVYGIDDPQYDVVSLAPPDRFDGWVVERERRLERVSSYRYVSPDVVGVEDLDEYGRWVPVPRYGMVWTPTVVEPGWSPYSRGHWVWQDPWGWTWIAAEPWGWAPYHYGRWFQSNARWYWAPVTPSAPRVAYAPALVAFVGGGGGASLSVSVGTGSAIGWFPLAPADPLIPWWGTRTQTNVTNVNVTNVKYVNKTYVTVVNQNTFISGDLVQNNIVRDQTVIRQVHAAPIASGPHLVPTRASLRVSVKKTAAPTPPPVVASRQVVARIAPPPEPPRFERKLKMIKESRGAPVAPVVATRLAAEDQETPRARATVRAVAGPQGEVRLRSRGKDRTVRDLQPVQPVRGRPLATTGTPVQIPQVAEEASAPSGAAQTPVEGREGRRIPPGHSGEHSRYPAQTPPPSANQPAATPDQPLAPARVVEPPAAGRYHPQPRNKQKKQMQDSDPSSPDQPAGAATQAEPPVPVPNQPQPRSTREKQKQGTESSSRDQPSGTPDQPQPPARMPSQPPAAGPNQAQPPGAQEKQKPEAEKRKQDKKKKGQPDKDPNGTTQ